MLVISEAYSVGLILYILTLSISQYVPLMPHYTFLTKYFSFILVYFFLFKLIGNDDCGYAFELSWHNNA